MKHVFILLLTVFLLTSCSNSSSKSPGDESNSNSEIFVDIAKLQSVGTLSVDTTNSLVEFGTVSSTSSSLTKIINLKNDSTGPVEFSLSSLTPSSGFTIKTNRCVSPLAARSTCAITISFSSRGLFTGSPFDYLGVTVGSNNLPIQFTAVVENQPDPNTSEPSLIYTLTTTTNGKTLTVKNNGPGNASNIVVTPPTGYVVSISRCGVVLKSSQSCVVTLLYNNYRSQPQSTAGSIVVAAKGTTALPPVSLSIVDGSLVATQVQIRVAKPSSAITITSSKSSCSGSCTELVENYSVGETVSLTATSNNEKLAVIGWSGDCSSSNSSCSFVANGNKNPSVVTEDRVYFISLNKIGTVLIYGDVVNGPVTYNSAYSYVNTKPEYDLVYSYLIKPGYTYITHHSSNPDYVYKWGGQQASCGYNDYCQITVNQDFENYVQYFKKSVDCPNPPDHVSSYTKEYSIANDGYLACEVKACADDFDLVNGACVTHVNYYTKNFFIKQPGDSFNDSREEQRGNFGSNTGINGDILAIADANWKSYVTIPGQFGPPSFVGCYGCGKISVYKLTSTGPVFLNTFINEHGAISPLGGLDSIQKLGSNMVMGTDAIASRDAKSGYVNYNVISYDPTNGSMLAENVLRPSNNISTLSIFSGSVYAISSSTAAQPSSTNMSVDLYKKDSSNNYSLFATLNGNSVTGGVGADFYQSGAIKDMASNSQYIVVKNTGGNLFMIDTQSASPTLKKILQLSSSTVDLRTIALSEDGQEIVALENNNLRIFTGSYASGFIEQASVSVPGSTDGSYNLTQGGNQIGITMPSGVIKVYKLENGSASLVQSLSPASYPYGFSLTSLNNDFLMINEVSDHSTWRDVHPIADITSRNESTAGWGSSIMFTHPIEKELQVVDSTGSQQVIVWATDENYQKLDDYSLINFGVNEKEFLLTASVKYYYVSAMIGVSGFTFNLNGMQCSSTGPSGSITVTPPCVAASHGYGFYIPSNFDSLHSQSSGQQNILSFIRK